MANERYTVRKKSREMYLVTLEVFFRNSINKHTSDNVTPLTPCPFNLTQSF